jgi:hypothetical protein
VVAITADQNLRIAFCLNVRRSAVLWASHLQKKGRSDWKCEWPKLHVEEAACASRAIQVSKHASSTHSDVYYSVDRFISSIFVNRLDGNDVIRVVLESSYTFKHCGTVTGSSALLPPDSVAQLLKSVPPRDVR